MCSKIAPLALVVVVFLSLCSARETSKSSFTSLESIPYRAVMSYQSSPSPYVGINDAAVFTRWTCGFSPISTLTYERESPSPDSFRTRFSPPFIAFAKIGGEDDLDFYKDPSGFSFSADPFSPAVTSWGGGKNWLDFSYFTESVVSNRGIASIFGMAFAQPNRPNDNAKIPTQRVIIPICSSEMPTIVSSVNNSASGLYCISSLFIMSLTLLLVV